MLERGGAAIRREADHTPTRWTLTRTAFTMARTGMTGEAWFWTAIALSGLGYATYLVGLRRHLVEPNRASWLIWAVATAVEAATYAAVNPRQPQSLIFALSAIACIAVAAAMWRRSRWSAPSPTESLCMGASLAAIALWIAFNETFWAHMLVVLAVPVSFWPTWASVIEDRRRERSPAWGLWTLADAATLALTLGSGRHGVGDYAYVVVELACHASVWLLVGLAALDPRAALRARGGRALLEAWAGEPAAFAVRQTHLGKAVFAARGFAAGEHIVRFGGRATPATAVGRALQGGADRFVQIGADRYLGPSGRVDDLVNHSCDPNAGVRFRHDGVHLIALRPIAAGEEIAWDYSTTLADPDWRMACACGSPACRGTVAAFATLPPERRDWYLGQGLVAPYLIEAVRAA